MKFALATTALTMLFATSGYAGQHTAESGLVADSYGPNTLQDQSATARDSANAKDSDSSKQARGGYRLLKYLTLEGQTSDIGEYKLGNGGDLVNTEFAACTGNLVGILPLGESGVELYGRFGAGLMSRQADNAFPVPEDNDISSVSTAGLGLRFTPAKLQTVTLTAGYDTYRFQLEDNYSRGSIDQAVSLAKLGLQYHF